MDIKLTKQDRILIKTPKQVADVMQRILKRESEISKTREHFWVIGLDGETRILYVELVSLGARASTTAEPMQVFKLALQKNAVNLILCHNHTGVNVEPSMSDKDTTDRLIQVGKIIDIGIYDHIIISDKTKKFMSFEETGLMDKLQQSRMYVPSFNQTQAIKNAAKFERTQEMVRVMRSKKMSVKLIAEITGLTERQIKRIK
ncbi:MAG TPA: JAB domain-containing protein [Bacteroidia bacterium]|nr:JAB domain-containing protein [Bacteroidia bacterium]